MDKKKYIAGEINNLGLVLLSECWIINNNSECLFPPKKANIRLLTKRHAEPKSDWQTYQLKRIFPFKFDGYDKALKALKQLEDVSSIETEEETGRGKRRKKKPDIYTPATSSDSEKENMRKKKKCCRKKKNNAREKRILDDLNESSNDSDSSLESLRRYHFRNNDEWLTTSDSDWDKSSGSEPETEFSKGLNAAKHLDNSSGSESEPECSEELNDKNHLEEHAQKTLYTEKGQERNLLPHRDVNDVEGNYSTRRFDLGLGNCTFRSAEGTQNSDFGTYDVFTSSVSSGKGSAAEREPVIYNVRNGTNQPRGIVGRNLATTAEQERNLSQRDINDIDVNNSTERFNLGMANCTLRSAESTPNSDFGASNLFTSPVSSGNESATEPEPVIYNARNGTNHPRGIVGRNLATRAEQERNLSQRDINDIDVNNSTGRFNLGMGNCTLRSAENTQDSDFGANDVFTSSVSSGKGSAAEPEPVIYNARNGTSNHPRGIVGRNLATRAEQERTLSQRDCSYNSGNSPRRFDVPNRTILRSTENILNETQNENSPESDSMLKISLYNKERLDLLTTLLGAHLGIDKLPTNFPNLPIKNEEDLANFESYISVPKNFALALNYLKKVGGDNEKSCLFNLLAELFTNKFSQSFNWHGREVKDKPKKAAFKNLKTKDFIVTFLQMRYNDHKDICGLVKKGTQEWLKNSKKRKKEKTN